MTKVELATNQVAKGFANLSKTLNASMADLTDEDVGKVFAFIELTLLKAKQQAMIDRQARMTHKGFSLSMELPAMAPSPALPFPGPTYPAGVRAGVTPEGRLFGAGRDGQTRNIALEDKEDECGFVED